MKKKIFLSSGRNDSYQLGHNKQDGCYHEMEVIPTNLQIKKVECGRSHVIFQTNDNELYALGRNDHGQCGVVLGDHNELRNHTLPPIQQLTICLNEETNSPLTNVNDFSVGWFHTVALCNNFTKVMFTGSYISLLYKSAFINHSEMKLKENQLKFTKVSSGCHCFAVAIDDRYILFKPSESELNEFDVLTVTQNNSCLIKQLECTSSAFLFLTSDNSCYCLNGINLKKFENLKKEIVKITACGLSADISFKTIDGYNYYSSFNENVNYREKNEMFDVIPYYFCFQYYNRQERKIYGNRNSDGQLGVGLANGSDERPAIYVNELLKNNPNFNIETICSGCDFSVIVLEEQETREEKRMKDNLFLILLNNNRTLHVSDIFIC
ncbi:hypothetical protein ABK040_006934 [Willaertia magna]